MGIERHRVKNMDACEGLGESKTVKIYLPRNVCRERGKKIKMAAKTMQLEPHHFCTCIAIQVKRGQTSIVATVYTFLIHLSIDPRGKKSSLA